MNHSSDTRNLRTFQPESALALLGHSLLGGALGRFGAITGVTFGGSLRSLEDRAKQRLAASPVVVERLGDQVLYVAWPEIWSEGAPLPLAVDRDSDLRDLLLSFFSKLRRPTLVSRPAATPRMLRSQLQHQMQAVVDSPRPIGSDPLALGAGTDSTHLNLLFERAGQVLAGACRAGLLASFGLSFEPLCAERARNRSEPGAEINR